VKSGAQKEERNPEEDNESASPVITSESMRVALSIPNCDYENRSVATTFNRAAPLTQLNRLAFPCEKVGCPNFLATHEQAGFLTCLYA